MALRGGICTAKQSLVASQGGLWDTEKEASQQGQLVYLCKLIGMPHFNDTSPPLCFPITLGQPVSVIAPCQSSGTWGKRETNLKWIPSLLSQPPQSSPLQLWLQSQDPIVFCLPWVFPSFHVCPQVHQPSYHFLCVISRLGVKEITRHPICWSF